MQVKCIGPRGVDGLTKGKMYEVHGEPFYVSNDPLIVVTNDRGKRAAYALHRFETSDTE
jgi:hypothetical protein